MKGVSFIIFIIGILLPVHAWPWGHLDFVGNEWGQATLAHKIVKNKQLRYCIEVDDTKRFPPSHISTQVRNAIEVWLDAALEYKNSLVVEVPCSQHEADLHVEIGPEKEFTEMSGYQVPQLDGNRFYSLVKLNSDFNYHEAGQTYQVADFAQMIPLPIVQKVISQVSLKAPMNVGQFSQTYKVHYQKAYLSTYKMLLHEIGHSFGLCDTAESLFKFCDTKYKTPDRPASVMNQADFFYLTEDDKEGLRQALKRFEFNLRVKN